MTSSPPGGRVIRFPEHPGADPLRCELPCGDEGGTHARLGGLDPAQFLDHVLETTATGLFMVDPEGRVMAWNRAMEEITGRRAETVLGGTCAVLEGNTCYGGPRARGERRCPLFAGETVENKRCVITSAAGDRVTLLKRARLVRDAEGRVIGGIEAVTDISGVVELESEVALLRREGAGFSRFGRIVGQHPSMARLADMIAAAGRTPSSTLILGETGTGKELVARAIHEASARREGPFVRVACAALSESLLESELFGHARGAFTGAVANRVGRFEAAHGGTLFLDEIGDISHAVQTKLLRALQEHEIERVGDNRTIPFDIRVIAATNRDLLALCEAGRYRHDLYYRLAVIPICVPPLRERASDIPLLVEVFVERLNRRLGRSIAGLSPEAFELVLAHSWPGNVRELEHAIEFAFAMTVSDLIETRALPPTIHERPSSRRSEERPRPAGLHRMPAPEVVRATLEACGGNRTQAAERLGVSRVALWKWLKKHGTSTDNHEPG